MVISRPRVSFQPLPIAQPMVGDGISRSTAGGSHRKETGMAPEASSQVLATPRLRFAPVEGAAELFTPAFVEYLVRLHDEFTPRIHTLRAKRADVLRRAHDQGIMPTYLPTSESNTGDWQVPPVPQDLLQPGIEISGPASITHMFINALNPGPDGTRAEGDLDDDEDSARHSLNDTVRATWNRLGAVERNLTFVDHERG